MDILLPYLNTAIAGFFAILLFIYYLLRRPSKTLKGKRAPEIKGGWPIIGHLPLFGGSELPYITLGSMADKYGPLFTFRFGVHPTLVVSSWETAKECFTTNDVAISTRSESIAIKHLGWNYAMFGFAPYGSYWREVRKIATVELLSNRRLELLKHVRGNEVETCLKELHEFWKEKKDGSGRAMVEMKRWFGDLSFNVVLRMIAGKRYFGATAKSDEKEAQRCQNAVRGFFRLVGQFVVADAIPFLGFLDLGGHEEAMKKLAKELDTILEEWVEEHRRQRASGEAREERDFMDVMMSVLEGTSLGGYDADTITKSTCMSLIGGGSDTTKTTLTWTLTLLLNNRHALRKAREELDNHVGNGRLVNVSDIPNLVYLQAIIKESLRLYPPGPLSGPRQLTEDCTIGGYHVPKGTRLVANLWKIQTDPRTWPDPLEFKPERFLTSHKDIDLRGQHFELIPFGCGRRVCPGISFGLQVALLTLAGLIHAFEISTTSDEPIDMTGSLGLTNIKAAPLDVFVKPRLSPNLYE